MTIDKTIEGAKVTFALGGRIDAAAIAPLETELKRELNGTKALVFDFEKVKYISSAGLRVLLSAQKRMNRQGRMRIIRVSQPVMDTFEITGFADILFVEGEESAQKNDAGEADGTL